MFLSFGIKGIISAHQLGFFLVAGYLRFSLSYTAWVVADCEPIHSRETYQPTSDMTIPFPDIRLNGPNGHLGNRSICFHELGSLGVSYVEYAWGREEKSPKPSWWCVQTCFLTPSRFAESTINWAYFPNGESTGMIYNYFCWPIFNEISTRRGTLQSGAP